MKPEPGKGDRIQQPRRGDRRDRPSSGPPQRPAWDKPGFLADAIAGGIGPEFIQIAQGFSKDAGRGLPVSQLRGIYGEVLKLEILGLEHLAERLVLLKPRLAYLAAREGGSSIGNFRKIIEAGIDKVLEVEGDERQLRFERFREGLEALLAYQHVYGRGRN